MSKQKKILENIVTLKRRQAEEVFESLNSQLRHLQKNQAQIQVSLEALFGDDDEAGDMNLLQKHQYSELLSQRLKEVERRESDLRAAIADAQSNLKQAVFSEDQIKAQSKEK